MNSAAAEKAIAAYQVEAQRVADVQRAIRKIATSEYPSKKFEDGVRDFYNAHMDLGKAQHDAQLEAERFSDSL